MEDFYVNPSNNDHIFVAGQSPSYGMGLHKSLNGGSSWTTYQANSSGTAYTVAVDPNNDQVVYLGGEKSGSGAVYRSVNGGTNWTEITGSISGIVKALAVDSGSTNRVYAGSAAGFFKSSDSGASWSKKGNFDVKCIKINPGNRAEIYAAGYSGVYRSLDYGENWEDFKNGLTVLDIRSMEIDSANKILYAGSANGGVYKSGLSDMYSLLAPLNFSGVKKINRSLLQIRYVNVLTWQANPNNANIAKYRIYRMSGSTKTLLAEVGAADFEYRHMNVAKDEAVTYACAAVSSTGREGGAAVTTVK